MMVGGSFNFIFNYDASAALFESIGVSASLVYPLAFAKILGVIAIVSNRIPLLKKLAYVGFAIELLSAITGHFIAGDGQFPGALVAFLLLSLSWFFDRRAVSAINN